MGGSKTPASLGGKAIRKVAQKWSLVFGQDKAKCEGQLLLCFWACDGCRASVRADAGRLGMMVHAVYLSRGRQISECEASMSYTVSFRPAKNNQ